jgi:hypothetical protein
MTVCKMDLDYLVCITKTYGINVIPYYCLYEAKKRLVLAKETIQLMGGEDDCQPMLLGQRDMLELEIEYYREQSTKFTIAVLTVITFCVTMAVLHFQYGVFNV